MHFLRATLPLLALIGSFYASGCSGGGDDNGGGGGSGSGASDGNVSFTVTDSASDQIESFVVDVTGVQLKKSDGAIVSVIGAPVTVDLATLGDTTQLLNLVSAPAGDYTSATITLDFTNASCVLVGKSAPASILDDNGLPVSGTVTFPIDFGQSTFTVLSGQQRMLEFDFALDESVDVDSTANSVSLEPSFALHFDGTGKNLLTFGALVSVDTSGSSFVASVKTLHGATFGNVTFSVDSSTIFQVDGEPGQGATGLALLNGKAAGTWVQVFGSIDPSAARILAHYVEAGTGTYNGGTDIVEGHVLDRVGNPSAGSNVTLTVLGRSNNAAHDAFQFDTTFTVTTNFAATKVVRPFSAQALDTDDLAVGQRVRIFGSLTGTTMNAATPTSVVREQIARTFGHATGAIAASTLTLDLVHVDLIPQGSFTWADSGTTPPTPSTFTANVGTLGNGLGITNGTAVETRGFFAPITDANQDLTAVALIDLDTAPALLFVKNLPGGFTVGEIPGSSEIQLDISGTAGAGEKAVVDQGFAGVVSLPTTPNPTIHPAAAAGLYLIRDKITGNVKIFFTFAPFESVLGTALSQGATIKIFAAVGQYTLATNTLQATLVSVVLQ
jgi:hypothetical protein